MLKMMLTATASPKARPRPSMIAPTMPPLAKGRTTCRSPGPGLPQGEGALRARPSGVSEKISRLMDVTMGMIMMATRRRRSDTRR